MTSYWLSKLRLLYFLCCRRKDVTFRSLSVFIDDGVRIQTQKGTILVAGQAHFARNCTLKASAGQISIGERFFLNENSRIVAHESVTFGRNCILADNVSIYDHDHRFGRADIPISDQGFDSKPVRLGNNVWVGSHAIICKGVTIGDNVIIAAGAVVTHDIESGSIAAGVPAKVLRPIAA